MWKQVGFWSLVFIVFPLTAVTLDTKFAISGVQNLSFGGLLPPFYQPGDHFVSLWTPWGTMGAAGRTRERPEVDFTDLGKIWEPILRAFQVSMS